MKLLPDLTRDAAEVTRSDDDALIDEIKAAPDAKALDVLQAIYRNPYLPTSVRKDAAKAALPFENPKLAVVASIYDPNHRFAEQLEAAIRRSGKTLMMIEHEPRPPKEPEPAEIARPMTTSIPDQHMKRF
jgi:hypothetical protein